MKSESDWDNAKELQSIEVKINKNGNKHEESYSKLGYTALFSLTPWKKRRSGPPYFFYRNGNSLDLQK